MKLMPISQCNGKLKMKELLKLKCWENGIKEAEKNFFKVLQFTQLSMTLKHSLSKQRIFWNTTTCKKELKI